MKKETADLVSKAEAHMNERRFTDAGRCYEMVAATFDDKGKIKDVLVDDIFVYPRELRDSDEDVGLVA